MPEYIGGRSQGWSIQKRCHACGHTYKYFSTDVVMGEDSRDTDRPNVYCGNCSQVLFLDNCVPRKVLARATRY